MDLEQTSKSVTTITNEHNDVKASVDLILSLLSGRNTAQGVVLSICQLLNINTGQDASTTNTTTTTTTSTSESNFQHLQRVQSFIINLSTEVPLTQQPLVELLAVLKSWPHDTIQDGIWGTFGMHEADIHSGLMYASQRTAQYININAFEARLWQHMGRDAVEEYLGTDPIRCLARSIEDPSSSSSSSEDQSLDRDTEVAAACVWATFAAQGIRVLCKRNERDEGPNNAQDLRGALWKGARGYSMARWTFWVERFRLVAGGGDESIGSGTRGYAETAVSSMLAADILAEE